MAEYIQISSKDNVAVALAALAAGTSVQVAGREFLLLEDIPQGHKFALEKIQKEDPVIKYGYPIGHATAGILPGEWVHTHNLSTNLSEHGAYAYRPAKAGFAAEEADTFMGYLRPDGRAGIRNEIWILPTVGCVNEIGRALAEQNAYLAREFGLDGVVCFTHPYGCSQMGEDHETTRKFLAALTDHPNAGAVLILGLGCENNSMEQLQEELSEWDEDRVHFMVCQQEADEIDAGSRHLQELARYAGRFTRRPVSVSRLVVGMKCGGSDGLSGVTANPLLGRFSDRLVAQGGSTVLTEVPEMFGAEQVLFDRCADRSVFDKAVRMVNDFKQYFVDHGQVVYENPSPGNKQGGISTLEDKSLGCVQKGGTAPVVDVIPYAHPVQKPGLTLLSGPGNDLVSVSALAAAGVHLVLFTTGRGTPFGGPTPTVKVSSNSALYKAKSNWIDFDAGPVADGESLDEMARKFYRYVLSLASGDVKTKSESSGYREIAIFKSGVTL